MADLVPMVEMAGDSPEGGSAITRDEVPMVEMAGDDDDQVVLTLARKSTDDGEAQPWRPPPPLKPMLSLAFIPARHQLDESDSDCEEEEELLEDEEAEALASPTLDRPGTVDALETRWQAKRLALTTNTATPSTKRASYEVTLDGVLRTDMYELRKTGFKRTTMLTKKLRRHAAPDALDVALGDRREAFGQLSSATLEQMGLLGRGASGQVMKSLHVPSMTVVAVKSIDVSEKSRRAQFAHELFELDTLDCPQIVEFHGAFYEEGHVFLALEFMDRGAMDSLIKSIAHGGSERRKPLVPPLAPHLRLHEKVVSNAMKQVLLGLNYLHASNKIHRDIKPGNMLYNHHGQVKLSDFGLTSSVDAAGGRDSFVGTTIYMSPERLAGAVYSLPSDIWSLGMSLVYMAQGTSPVSTVDGYWGIISHINEDYDPKLDPAIYSPALIDFVYKCLAKDPALRWTCAQLLEHPFITEGPASIEETLPYWPKQCDMGVDKEDDFSLHVDSWRLKQLNRKASMKLRQQGQRGTIFTHAVYHKLSEDGETVLATDEDPEDGIVMLPQSFAAHDDDQAKRSHGRILRRTNTRDETQLDAYASRLRREDILRKHVLHEETDEFDADDVEPDRRRRRVNFVVDDISNASSPPLLSGVASPALSRRSTASAIHIADAMYMAAATQANLYSTTPDVSQCPSPRMSPVHGLTIVTIPEGVAAAIAAASPRPYPSDRASSDGSSTPVRSPPIFGPSTPGTPLGCSSPYLLSPTSRSGPSSPRTRSHRHSRIVNGNLVVIERTPLHSPTALRNKTDDPEPMAKPEFSESVDTVLSVTPLGQLASAEHTPTSADQVLSALPPHLQRMGSTHGGDGIPGGIVSLAVVTEKAERHHQPILFKADSVRSRPPLHSFSSAPLPSSSPSSPTSSVPSSVPSSVDSPYVPNSGRADGFSSAVSLAGFAVSSEPFSQRQLDLPQSTSEVDELPTEAETDEPEEPPVFVTAIDHTSSLPKPPIATQDPSPPRLESEALVIAPSVTAPPATAIVLEFAPVQSALDVALSRPTSSRPLLAPLAERKVSSASPQRSAVSSPLHTSISAGMLLAPLDPMVPSAIWRSTSDPLETQSAGLAPSHSLPLLRTVSSPRKSGPGGAFSFDVAQGRPRITRTSSSTLLVPSSHSLRLLGTPIKSPSQLLTSAQAFHKMASVYCGSPKATPSKRPKNSATVRSPMAWNDSTSNPAPRRIASTDYDLLARDEQRKLRAMLETPVPSSTVTKRRGPQPQSAVNATRSRGPSRMSTLVGDTESPPKGSLLRGLAPLTGKFTPLLRPAAAEAEALDILESIFSGGIGAAVINPSDERDDCTPAATMSTKSRRSKLATAAPRDAAAQQLKPIVRKSKP